jgi:hypothetical protein
MVAELAKCVRTDADCADICAATAAVLSRHTGYDANITRAILQACATVCKACGDECDPSVREQPNAPVRMADVRCVARRD